MKRFWERLSRRERGLVGATLAILIILLARYFIIGPYLERREWVTSQLELQPQLLEKNLRYLARKDEFAAGLEASHSVRGVAFDGEEQHGRLDAFAAQLRTELDAVHVGHHHVEHDEIELRGAQVGKSREPVVRDVGAIALGFEVLADAGREMRLVVDDENVGRVSHR